MRVVEITRRAALESHLLAIEARSWKAARQTSIGTEPAAERFYRALGRRFAEAGRLRSYLLYLGDEPVAHLFGLTHRGSYFALKSSYDPQREELSPGVLLFAHALEDCFDGRLSRFEILGDAQQWKRQLATHWRRSVDVCLFTHLISRCGWIHAKDVARPLLERHAPRLIALKRRVDRLRREEE